MYSHSRAVNVLSKLGKGGDGASTYTVFCKEDEKASTKLAIGKRR